MWLPLTSRSAARAFAPSRRAITSEIQGPAAFTSARAAIVSLRAGARVAALDQPMVAAAPRRHDLGAHADVGAAPRRVHGVEHDEARIVDPAVGIFEAAPDIRA